MCDNKAARGFHVGLFANLLPSRSIRGVKCCEYLTSYLVTCKKTQLFVSFYFFFFLSVVLWELHFECCSKFPVWKNPLLVISLHSRFK